jgi:hypothetical protein
MSNTTKLSFSLYLTVLGILVLTTMSVYRDHQYHEYKKQTEITIDSLKNEIFIKDITIGTYEVMWSSISDIHPELVDEIESKIE